MDSIKAWFKLITIWICAIVIFTGCVMLFAYTINCRTTEYTILVDGQEYTCESYTEGYDLNGELTRIRLYTNNKETIVNVDNSSVIDIKELKETIPFKEWLTSETLKNKLKDSD